MILCLLLNILLNIILVTEPIPNRFSFNHGLYPALSQALSYKKIYRLSFYLFFASRTILKFQPIKLELERESHRTKIKPSFATQRKANLPNKI